MTPILDPRRSEQLMADLLRRRAGYVPTFAPAPGGPGSALLQITAGEVAALVERLDQAPDKLGLALLDLVGVGLVPAQPARAPVVFTATPGVGDATAPAGSRLGARVPGREDPIVFETESTIAIAGARLVEVASVDPGRDAYVAHAADLGAGREVTLFAQPTPFAHELYLGHATAFAFAGRVVVEIDLTLRLGASQHLPLAAAWFDGTAWQPFAAFAEPAGDEDSHDGTDGLQHGGVVRLTTACAHAKPTAVNGVTTHWVRLTVTAPLSPGRPATLPVVDRLDARSIIEHRRVIQSVAGSPAGTVVGVWTPLGAPVADGQKVTVTDLVSHATQIVTTAGGTATPALAAGETYAFALGDPVDPDDFGLPITMPADPQRIDLAGHAGLPLDKGVCDGKTLDLTKSFQPLGPTPDAGAALYLACADVFGKAGAEVTLVLDRPKTVQEEAGEQGQMYEIEVNAARDLLHQIEQELTDIATALDAANAALAAPLPLLIKAGDTTDHWYKAIKLALEKAFDALGSAGGPFAVLIQVFQAGQAAVLAGQSLTDALRTAVEGARDLVLAFKELGATTAGIDQAVTHANDDLATGTVASLTHALIELNTKLVEIDQGGLAFLGAIPSFLAMVPEDYVAAVTARIAAAVTAFTTAAAGIRAVVAELEAFNPAALVAVAGGPSPGLTPAQIAWEYWNGERWLALEMLAGTSSAAANFTGPGKVRFRVPDGWEPSAVAGDTRLWLRARVASGRFARLRLVAWTDAKSNVVNFLPVIEPRPPTLGGIDVYYRYASPTGPPEAALAANDAGWRDLSGSLHWPGPSFAPYLPCSDPAPTLYLGFDAPLPAERIGVFLGVPDRPDAQPTDFRCEAFDGAVFRPAVVEDGTRGLTMAGVVHLVWPGDDGGFASLVVQAAGTTVRLAEAGAGLRYAPGATLWLADQAGGELVDVAAVDDRVLTLQRSVSRTYSGATMRAAPPARFGTPRAWLRLVLDADAEPPPVVLTAVLANAVSAANTLTVVDEILGGADGSPGQVLFLRNAPVLAGATIQVRELEGPRAAVDAPILKDELAAQRRPPGDFVPTVDPVTGVVTEVWVTWQVRDTLAFSGPDDRDCTIDGVGGRVLFGDGTFGRIPPAGRDNVRASYRAGGNGPDGNVPAGAIASVLSGVLAQGVTNPLPALGGAGGETLSRLAGRGPNVLRHRHQSLTAADYEALAYDASAAVARARALGATDASGRTIPGLVRLVIVPIGREPAPQPTGELRRQVADLIQARMPLTIGRGLTVVGPAYTRVGVDVTVRASRPEQAGTLREAVRDAITRFLHPVAGGACGDGFAFGARMSSSDLARELATLPDLDALIELAFVVDDLPAGEQFTLAADRLPTAGRIRVAVSELA